MENSSRWIIASNRLPFSWDRAAKKLRQSSGGLVTAISGIQSDVEKIWVGSAPEGIDAETWKVQPETRGSEGQEYKPVFIEEELYSLYYNGMCNDVLWPLLHYESGMVEFSDESWQAYVDVNHMFAKEILKTAKEGDLVWIHDFHLLLVPGLLKAQNPKLKVGLFLHIPFPSSEVFRQLPVRKEILRALLCADLLGFHDYSYLRHFCSTIKVMLGVESSMLSIEREHHTTHLGVFPVSIDVAEFKREAACPEVRKTRRRFQRSLPYEKLILGVDRLDYIKGLPLKLKAFRKLLESHPELRGRVGLLQITVPSRTDVPGYKHLRQEIEQLVGEINGQFAQPGYVPVQYMFQSVKFDELLALYRLSDVLLVTSKRDGMNLVALEHIVSQRPSDPGVVVLSEFAGAISTLSHIIPTNPWDCRGTAEAVYKGLTMERSERVSRHRSMMRYLDTYSATDWAESFMASLTKRSKASVNGGTLNLSKLDPGSATMTDVLSLVSERELLVFLDYDGTVVPICDQPDQAVLKDDVKQRLREIAEMPHVHLVVVSGRDKQFLREQLGDLPIGIAAEHGAIYASKPDGPWKRLAHGDRRRWYRAARQVMSDYASRVPESFVERKKFGIAWHYRKSPKEFAAYQARKLKHDLELALSNLPVSVISGKKVIEARSAGANKGTFVRWYLENHKRHRDRAIVAFGDDQTDEDIFSSIEAPGLCIRVGHGSTVADYRIETQGEVLPLLERLVQMGASQLELPGLSLASPGEHNAKAGVSYRW